MIRSTLLNAVKTGFNMVGLEVIREKNCPRLTLLGLASRPIGTVIDVGANTGQFAKKIVEFFPRAELHCFEPLPQAFAQLNSWAQTRGGKVVPYNMALGSKECETEMFLHEDHTPSSSLLSTTTLTGEYFPATRGKKRVSIKQTTLDAVLAGLAPSGGSEMLIKLDVQGYEDRVIAGGKATFSKAKACILEVNVDTLYEGQARFITLHGMLHELGFQYVGNLEQTYAEDGHCIFLEAVFVKGSSS